MRKPTCKLNKTQGNNLSALEALAVTRPLQSSLVCCPAWSPKLVLPKAPKRQSVLEEHFYLGFSVWTEQKLRKPLPTAISA